jgi:3-oxoadipate enol-lactonase
MPFLERPNVQLYYDFAPSLEQDKPIMTFVNGHTRSSGDFKVMARQMSQIGVSCLLFDNRASGRSITEQPFTLNDMRDDVIALWDHLKIQRSDLLGISMGGFISQCIAAQYTNRVRRLILVSTAADERWIQPTEGSWTLLENEVEKKLGTYFAPGFTERNKLLFSTMVKQTRQAIQEGSFAMRSDMQRAALKANTIEIMHSNITIPTLIVHGNEDKIIHVDGARDLKNRIVSSQLEILKGVGHLILAESPKSLYEIVQNFILSQRPT